MLHVFYNLFMACGMFTIATAMWRKSNSLCNECRKELNK